MSYPITDKTTGKPREREVMNGRYHIMLRLTDDEKWRLKFTAAKAKMSPSELLQRIVKEIINQDGKEKVNSGSNNI